MDIDELYDQYKPLLFTLAYQLTGTTVDSEDLIQDVFVKLHHVDLEKLEKPKAYLCKMVTNQCLDYLQSARKRREHYVGTWLPEPVIVSEDISNIVVENDLLSYAMLVLMEQLTPVERAVFLLKEAYTFNYRTIASFVDKSEVNCRKIFSRASLKLRGNETIRNNPDNNWMSELLFALKEENVEKLLSLLSEDVTVYSDGGGKVPAAIHPIQTPEKVLRFLGGLLKRLPQFGMDARMERIAVNAEEGIIVRTENDIILVALFNMDMNRIKNIYFVRNPDKLETLRKQLD
ncbi:RNA polymerase sigma factor SigJ [Paucisalibacillus sp. EB02]|uniref:RNA polymerase sigma factor SigJ n=1 Tax=Paucisalibacillus sp. EB02 TaxID=1347087 RepID=UPI000693EB8C|nr:RNA polymerase sigma factor SigJ [Paucisalibacillus sp. EB02]